MTKGSKFDDFLKDENIEIDEEKIKENIEQMTDKEIINSTNSQKISAYCKTCVCKSCEQVAWLEPENIELKAENERLKEEIKNNKSAYQVELGVYNMECGNLLKENEQYYQTLQEIKKIAEVGQDKYHNGLIIAKPIIDLITKAEINND